jgi:hypothetical protein
MPANGISLSNVALLASLSSSPFTDVTLDSWTIDGIENVDGPATLNFDNSYNGTALTALAVVVTPHNPAATVGTISLTPDPLTVGVDSMMAFVVTAEDGVTTGGYEVMLHVLTAGVAEVTTIVAESFVNVGGNFTTVGAGYGFAISNGTERIGFWINTGSETQPNMSALGVTSYVEVFFSPFESINILWSHLASVMSVHGFTATTSGTTTITATDSAIGARVDAVEDTTMGTRFVITTITQGENIV